LIRLPLLTSHPSICAQTGGVLRPFCAQVFGNSVFQKPPQIHSGSALKIRALEEGEFVFGKQMILEREQQQEAKCLDE
jgi:hypothetical protein